MIRKLANLSVLGLGIAALCGSAFAHHGSQGYDHTKRITVQATVKEFLWANPHAELYIEGKDESGTVKTWDLELNSPGNLVHANNGWTRTVLKPGDQVTVSFNPGKEGRPIGICTDVTLANGQKLHSNQGCVGGQPTGPDTP